MLLGCVYIVHTDKVKRGDNTKTSTNENLVMSYTIPIVATPKVITSSKHDQKHS